MKLHLFLKYAFALATFSLISLDNINAQITVDASFEGGNGVATYTDVSTNEVHLSSELKGGDTKNIVYYAEISGLNPSMPLTLTITCFWRGKTLVYSHDNIIWEKTALSTAGVATIPLTSGTVYVAHTYPYTYSNMIADVDSVAGRDHVNVIDMAVSEGGRPVKLVRITDECVDDAGKELIWVYGRMHAFECPGNYAVKGMLYYFSGNEPSAARLRKEAIIYVVPMMDVDMAYNGGSGKDQTPVDFNRDWYAITTPSHWNAVKAAKQWMDSTSQLNNFSVFFESHSPPPGGLSLFYYIYEMSHHLTNTRFVAESVQHLGNYRATEFIYNSLDVSISQDYVIANYDNPKHYNVTMETGFNNRTDGVPWTKDLYLLNGKYHAEAISDYIHGMADTNDVLIDNTDADNVMKMGSWLSDNSIDGYYGADYIYADTSSPSSITFSTLIDSTGTYEIFTRWVSDSSFAKNVPASFNYAGGSRTYSLDMSLRGGTWISLDTLELSAGSLVNFKISNVGVNRRIIADGFRMSSVTYCPTGSIPNTSSVDEKWEVNTYPNPTQGSLTFSFALSKKNDVHIQIYNSQGQRVKTMTHPQMNSGKQSIVWDGRNDAGRQVDAGIYFALVQTNHYQSVTKKIVMIR